MTESSVPGEARKVFDELESKTVPSDEALADDTTEEEHATDQNAQVPGSPEPPD
jgi:hypothetical protein